MEGCCCFAVTQEILPGNKSAECLHVFHLVTMRLRGWTGLGCTEQGMSGWSCQMLVEASVEGKLFGGIVSSLGPSGGTLGGFPDIAIWEEGDGGGGSFV